MGRGHFLWPLDWFYHLTARSDARLADRLDSSGPTLEPVGGALKRSDFDFELPHELIAQQPLSQRSASRLLLLGATADSLRDLRMAQLPQLLEPGDLLVFNDTRVLPARIAARKLSGGRVELLLERPLAGRQALVQLRDSKAIRLGMLLQSAGGMITVIERHAQFWKVELPTETLPFFEAHGLVPLPPYIERSAESSDRERYQSVFARIPGAVAAPTASLHFDEPLLAALAARGIEHALTTLHVGAATFQPLRSESLEEHVMHSEWYQVSEQTAAAVKRTRATGRRVVAVGTTVARALESAALASRTVLAASEGETMLFIRPGYRFQVIDALLTNFHLPQSTLLMLVAAFAGRMRVLDAYRHAVQARYRFFSYGDAMLVFAQAPSDS